MAEDRGWKPSPPFSFIDLVSLAIVLGSCLWTSSLSQRYCYGGLIVTCHKSSFDQLIFTYCKRLTQLSKQFFTVVLLFLSSFSGSSSLPLSLFYNFCVSSLLFYTFLFLLCLPVSEYITHSFSLQKQIVKVQLQLQEVQVQLQLQLHLQQVQVQLQQVQVEVQVQQVRVIL